MSKEPIAPEVSEVAGLQPTVEHLEHNLDRLLEIASVSKVFGEPLQQGETTILPAAEVMAGVGFGIGFGRGSNSGPHTHQGGDDGKPMHEGGGGGGGGGGSALARPVAVVSVSPAGVRVEPVIDVTKVALAAITAGGFMLATWFGMARPKKPRL